MHQAFLPYPQPRLLVSPCLLQVACRYDGTDHPCPAARDLAPWVEFLPLCPEVEAGMPVPRPPMKFVAQGEQVLLQREQEATDLLPGLADWAATEVHQLPPLEGALLKARSPSCAWADCKLHQGSFHGPLVGQRPGFFAQALLQARPGLAVCNEEQLVLPSQRHAFLTQLFVLARFRQAASGQDFLTQHEGWLALVDNGAGVLRQAASQGATAFGQALAVALTNPPQVQRAADQLARRLGLPPQPLDSAGFARWGQELVLIYGKKFPWIELIFYPFPRELR